MNTRRIPAYILLIVSFFLLFIFLFWHLKLGLVRYFDVDEFAHLHWASHMAMGKKPYTDFLYFFPPGYQWFLEPIFWIGKGTAPLVAARIIEFLVFSGLVAVTSGLFYITRKSLWAAVFAGAILAFLPLPYDKFLEIRPDTLAATLAMLGMLFQILWMRQKNSIVEAKTIKAWTIHMVQSKAFWSGIFYGLSLLVLPKTAPAVGVAAIIALLKAREPLTKRIDRTNTIFLKGSLASLLVGFFIPFLLFGVWALTLGDLSTVIYSLTQLPVEANKISQTFIMMPDLFFYPNQTFYGTAGYSYELLANHAIWIVALVFGISRLLLPYVSRGKEGAQEELLISGTFITHIIFYVQLVPLKHTQYLIPIAPFVAFYAADALHSIRTFLERWEIGRVGFVLTFIVLGFTLLGLNTNGIRQKLTWTNTQTFDELNALYKTIPFTEPILDLDGRTLYYPDPYIACCLPFGQSARYLSHPLPSLAQTLESAKTKYIYQGELKRVGTLLPEDQSYISENYTNRDPDGKMLVRK
jgi:hypothetical protein